MKQLQEHTEVWIEFLSAVACIKECLLIIGCGIFCVVIKCILFQEQVN